MCRPYLTSAIDTMVSSRHPAAKKDFIVHMETYFSAPQTLIDGHYRTLETQHLGVHYVIHNLVIYHCEYQ